MLEITCKFLVVELLAVITDISLTELLTQQLFVCRSVPHTTSALCLNYKLFMSSVRGIILYKRCAL